MNALLADPRKPRSAEPASSAPDTQDGTLKPERVAVLIREMILRDELSPGMPIRERRLAQELGVSRTPLREALKILRADGLVELSPRRGATVAEPSPGELRHLLQVLGALEGFAGHLACDVVTDAEIRQLRALHYDMLAAYMRSDRLSYFHHNQAIHRLLVEVTRNTVLIDHHRKVNAQVYRIRYISNLRTERWVSAIQEHEAILDALEQRDRPRIREILEGHVLKAFDQMQREEEAAAAEGEAGTARAKTRKPASAAD